MAKQTINIGTVANDGTGDPLRTGFNKTNSNFTELYNRVPNLLGSSRWYTGFGIRGTPGFVAVNSIRFTPFILFETATLDQLGAFVTTTEAVNIQLAVYANSASTLRPTGNALGSTGNISINSPGAVAGAITPAQLTGGLYWFARNSNTAGTGQTVNVSNTDGVGSSLTCSTTQANVVGSSAWLLTGYSFAQTFGTWPDMTGQAVVETNGSSAGPFPLFRVASVP